MDYDLFREFTILSMVSSVFLFAFVVASIDE